MQVGSIIVVIVEDPQQPTTTTCHYLTMAGSTRIKHGVGTIRRGKKEPAKVKKGSVQPDADKSQSQIESLQRESDSKNREAKTQVQDQIAELKGSREEAAQLKAEMERVVGALENFERQRRSDAKPD
jgi:hypothetical protein